MIVCVAFSITSGASDREFLSVAEIDGHGLEPRRVDEKGCLSSDGIESDHIPKEPCLHSSCVTVSWKPCWPNLVAAFGDLAGLFDRSIWTIDEVEEIWHVEGTLIG